MSKVLSSGPNLDLNAGSRTIEDRLPSIARPSRGSRRSQRSWDIPYLIRYITRFMALEPGDVVFDRHAAGSGAGRRSTRPDRGDDFRPPANLLASPQPGCGSCVLYLVPAQLAPTASSLQTAFLPPPTETQVRTLLRAARERLGVDIAYLTKFTEGHERIDVMEGDSTPFSFGEASRIPMEETYCRRMVEGTAPGLVPDTSREPRMQDLAVAEALGCYLGVPVKLSNGRVYGALCCAANDPNDALSDDDETYVRLLADGLATMVEHDADAAAAPSVGDDGFELMLWFAGVTQAPASARAALSALEPHVGNDRLQSLRLVVTELITNSIRHAGIDERAVIGLDLRLEDGLLRCTVSDPGPGFEKLDVVRPHQDRAGGFGLVILESVSSTWGVARDELFRVWFEVPIR